MSEQKMREAIESLRQKFTSGNNVPVERAIITRAEYEALVAPVLDGYVLVPSKMVLTPEALEVLQDLVSGTEADNADAPVDDRWMTTVLFVGEAIDDDGKKVHGLHAYSEDYPEDGCTTLVAFPANEAKRGEE